ncbi:glycosyltransferase [Sphingobacterium sp.]|uniref:glycosyltransferase n=1 Tax=Sphingobacterium sp. TaxID=341027 RepID=UPI00289A8E0D|nr:glycosyltransferase [Sphingobacterium sp.]
MTNKKGEKKVALVAHYGEDYYKSRVDFIRFLEQKKMECFSLVPQDDYQEKIENLSQKVYFYKYSRNWKFILSLYSNYQNFIKIFKRESPDIIFTYKFFPNIVGILSGRKANIHKIIATVAGIGFLENRDKSLFINLVFKFYIKVLDKANFVVAQNIEDFNLLKNSLKYAKVIMTNGSGVNSSNLLANDIDTFFANNNLDPNKKYIAFCSRIVKEKGVLELIEAFNNIALNDYPYDLIIAGWFDQKELEAQVKNLIAVNPKIHYIGYQKNVADLLAVTDVVALPSYYPEGVPRSLIEALSMSKLILTTNHKGCKETCIDSYNGFLVEPRSKKSIEKALERLASFSPIEISKFQENSLSLFEEKFDREVVFKSILDGINE